VKFADNDGRTHSGHGLVDICETNSINIMVDIVSVVSALYRIICIVVGVNYCLALDSCRFTHGCVSCNILCACIIFIINI